jgi:hypothetical protein
LSDAGVFGHEHKRQPDMFRENETAIKPLLAEKNHLYTFWLTPGKDSDKNRHVCNVRRLARRAIRKAKDDYFSCKAMQAEKIRHSVKRIWQCIRISKWKKGYGPCENSCGKDENGNECTTIEAQQE